MEMKELESADPESYQQISTPGNWTVTRTDRSFTSTAMDQTIEQTINRQCKTSGGIQGVTLNPGKYTSYRVCKLKSIIVSLSYLDSHIQFLNTLANE